MRSDRFRPHPGWFRWLVIAAALSWGLVAYVRDLLQSKPKPALAGEGLLLVVLNVVALVCLSAGIWLTRSHRERRESRALWEPREPSAVREPWARWSHRRRTGGVLLLVSIGASLWLYGLSSRENGGFVFALVALWVLLNLLPIGWGAALTVVTVAAVGLIGWDVFTAGSDFGLMAAFAGVALGALATRQRVLAQEATKRAEADTLLLAERSHIAREIHDILAHSLSAQIVHLEGARLLLARDGDRVQALDRVERAQGLARSGLEETRRALATLRGDAPQPEEALAELAEEFRASTGRPCETEVAGTPHELSPQAGLAVIRTAQEALTNVRKHAPGARVRVRLAYLDGQVELEVVDTGGTEPALAADLGGGYGLVGMRERAELIGGTLDTGPDGEGFRVSLRVPV
ncbi:sensor histidine kinase [Spirillospora sp. NPDC048911]|uniref:sensor histidine kinase n=1 Tax=Spirillospora sp. NPDC048911 TaxID=3364527 RepID=UPI003720DBAC